jgi:hypothetical protein
VDHVDDITSRRPLMPYLIFAVVAILWVAFSVALIVTAGSLEAQWDWVRGQSIVVQGVMWVLLLPWMAALAIWEGSFALGARLAIVAGLAVVNLYLFFPKAS